MNNARKFHKTLTAEYFHWQKFLDWWLGGREYLREVVFGYERPVRVMITGTNHLLRQMLFYCDPWQNDKRHRGAPHVWVSVHQYGEIDHGSKRPRPDYTTAKMTTALFDLDADVAGASPRPQELIAPYADMKELLEHFGPDARAVFSGRKGFQVHVNMRDGVVPDREWMERITDLLGLDTADTSVFGDKTRVCRLPFSLHPTSGLFCVPVSPGDDLQDILKASAYPQTPRRW